MLRNDNLGPTRIHLFNDPIGIKGLVRQQAAKFNALDQRRNADRIKAMAGQKHEANQIAEGVGQSQNFGRPTAF